MSHVHNIRFEYLADRPEFVPLVIDWWRTIWADRMGNDVGLATEQLRNSLSRSELPIHILAMVNGKPVGTAALKSHELAELFPDHRYWLGSVFVEEAARGGQIASQLSLQVVKMAKQMNCPQLYLQTIHREGGLYAALGWEPVREFVYMNEQTLLMCKRL